MAFRSVHCAFNDCDRCIDGAALRCACLCHRTGERTLRYCDFDGGCPQPATNVRHHRGFRLCVQHERSHYVDERGAIVPRGFNAFLSQVVNDCIEAS